MPLAIYRRVGGTRSSMFPLFLQVFHPHDDDKTENGDDNGGGEDNNEI